MNVLTHTRKGGVADSARQARSKADLAAGVAVEPAGEVEFEQHHLHRARLDAPDRRMISSTGTGDGPSKFSIDPSASSPFTRSAGS